MTSCRDTPSAWGMSAPCAWSANRRLSGALVALEFDGEHMPMSSSSPATSGLGPCCPLGCFELKTGKPEMSFMS